MKTQHRSTTVLFKQVYQKEMISQVIIPQAVFLCQLLAQKYVCCAPVDDMCQQPANLSVAYNTFNQGNDARLKFLVPPSRSLSRKEVPESALTEQCDSKKYGDTCPEDILEGSHIPVYARSNCPWTYAVDHDPLRFPSTMLVAKSRCTYCIGSNSDLECNPITQSLRVLKRGECIEGLYQYIESTQEVTIGFTCAGRKTVQDILY